MGVDVFIHPEYPPLLEPRDAPDYLAGLREREYGAYLRDLERRVGESELAVLVQGRFAGPLCAMDAFAYRFASEDLPDHETGFVARADTQGLARLLDEHRDREWRLHGLWARLCVTHFAIQAFGYLAYGEMWDFEGRGSPGDGGQAPCGEAHAFMDRVARHERLGDFRRSRMRIGIALESSPQWIALPEGSPSSPRAKPYGDVTYQLIDERSRIRYPGPLRGGKACAPPAGIIYREESPLLLAVLRAQSG